MNIELEFYDEKERASFAANYPSEYTMFYNSLGLIDIPIEDFKTYFLFRAQAKDPANIFQSFNREMIVKWSHFNDYFNYNPDAQAFTTRLRPDGMNEIAEGLGVAGALSISSKVLLNLTQADWRKIPVMQTRDLDFSHIASNGNKYIQVEAKGCFVEDNASKSQNIYAHKANIKAKKDNPAFKKKYSTSIDCFYGIITCVDPSNNLKSYLVDPPAASVELDPKKYRLLARMYYYHDFTHHISSRSFVSIVLSNRIKTIERSTNFIDFNGQVLTNSSFEKLSISESFMNTRSHIDVGNDRFLGKCEVEVLQSSTTNITRVVFVGIPLNVYNILISQNFDNLLSYKHQPRTIEAVVTCRVRDDGKHKAFFRSLDIISKEGFYSFYATTELTIASSGLIYGLIRDEQISASNF